MPCPSCGWSGTRLPITASEPSDPSVGRIGGELLGARAVAVQHEPVRMEEARRFVDPAVRGGHRRRGARGADDRAAHRGRRPPARDGTAPDRRPTPCAGSVALAGTGSGSPGSGCAHDTGVRAQVRRRPAAGKRWPASPGSRRTLWFTLVPPSLMCAPAVCAS
ncbi:hypothetical protein [Streptomyces broussonetiae]|uniref:hypothetical protein n=1 Tax=Streptomyces broussonetiae TaxID=2686304 RepID=UPI0035D732EE